MSMDNEKRKASDYAVACINEFAKSKSLSCREAYLYLYNHSGIKFLKEFYEIEHTLSFDDAINDLTIISQKNGGGIQ